MDFTFDHQDEDLDSQCDIDQNLLSEFSDLSCRTNTTESIKANQSPFSKKIIKKSEEEKLIGYCKENYVRTHKSSFECTAGQCQSFLMKCRINPKKQSKSLKTTKEQISNMLQQLAKRREIQELELRKFCDEKDPKTSYFVSMKDVLNFESN